MTIFVIKLINLSGGQIGQTFRKIMDDLKKKNVMFKSKDLYV